MKKFSFILTAVFMFSTVSVFAQNENAEAATGIEMSSEASHETSEPAVAAPVTLTAAKNVEDKIEANEVQADAMTAAQRKESKQNADMIRRQARDLTDNARTARKKAEADAKIIRNQARNDEKTVTAKVSTMKEKAAAEKKHSDNEAKALEDQAKAIRERAKSNQKETLNEANAMAQKAKETRQAAYQRADDLVNVAIQNEKEAQKQSGILLQSVPK
ncbi:MAG: hypothetical protein FWG57_07665 [Endomicrobia bacterium]|nr:hypothetical protein [Endomicrobiia bacterium]